MPLNNLKIISHRGNLNGPDNKRENSPEHLVAALNAGFNVELDVWVKDENSIFLGHDQPSYLVDLAFILKNSEKFWVHCKNIEAMEFFHKLRHIVNFFGHTLDDFVLTSKGYIFTKPGHKQTPKSVCVMPEKGGRLGALNFLTEAVCTDFPILYRDKVLQETFHS